MTHGCCVSLCQLHRTLLFAALNLFQLSYHFLSRILKVDCFRTHAFVLDSPDLYLDKRVFDVGQEGVVFT